MKARQEAQVSTTSVIDVAIVSRAPRVTSITGTPGVGIRRTYS